MSGQIAEAEPVEVSREPAETPNLEERLRQLTNEAKERTGHEWERARQALEAVLPAALAGQALRIFNYLAEMRDAEAVRAENEGGTYGLHGLAVVMNYDPQKGQKGRGRYFSAGEKIMGEDSDIFKGHIVGPGNRITDDGFDTKLRKAMGIDGVVLVDRAGYALHSGYIISLDAKKVLRKHPLAQASYVRMGDHAEPGTRHLNVFAATALLDDIVVLTLKSDAPQIRIIYQGQALHSTCEGEANYQKQAPSLYASFQKAAAAVASVFSEAYEGAGRALGRALSTLAAKLP